MCTAVSGSSPPTCTSMARSSPVTAASNRVGTRPRLANSSRTRGITDASEAAKTEKQYVGTERGSVAGMIHGLLSGQLGTNERHPILDEDQVANSPDARRCADPCSHGGRIIEIPVR